MTSCKKKVYKRMCENDDGSRTGKFGKVYYKSTMKHSHSKKTTKRTVPKAATPVRVIGDGPNYYENAYDRHLDDLEAEVLYMPDQTMQKMYLRDAYMKRQSARRKRRKRAWSTWRTTGSSWEF